MADARRTNRYSEMLQHFLASVFLNDVSDPVLKALQVSDVEVTPDLKIAKIYYLASSVGKASETECAKAFRRVTPFLKARIAQELDLRYVPELRFFRDNQFESAVRVNKILSDLSQSGVSEENV